MVYELLVALVFCGQLLAAAVIGIFSSVITGLLKHRGKVTDGKSFYFVMLFNAIGLVGIFFLRIITPQYFLFYSGDMNLDGWVNFGYFVIAFAIACAAAKWMYGISRNTIPVIGKSLRKTLADYLKEKIEAPDDPHTLRARLTNCSLSSS